MGGLLSQWLLGIAERVRDAIKKGRFRLGNAPFLGPVNRLSLAVLGRPILCSGRREGSWKGAVFGRSARDIFQQLLAGFRSGQGGDFLYAIRIEYGKGA